MESGSDDGPEYENGMLILYLFIFFLGIFDLLFMFSVRFSSRVDSFISEMSLFLLF